ncbi:MAG TPA: hypothetical protein VD865_14950 [Stenotrophomonas sp.]|nr:hypothetical protein [Stenotrophomonas sp.]
MNCQAYQVSDQALQERMYFRRFSIPPPEQRPIRMEPGFGSTKKQPTCLADVGGV